MSTRTSIDRRDLVKLGGLVSAAALTAGAAQALASEKASAASDSATSAGVTATSDAPWLPASWDYEADVIVVGCGGAGLCALIEARDQGMSAIGIEHMSITGGNSRICNGGMDLPGSPLQKEQGIEDSADIFYEDLINNLGDDVNEPMMRLYADLSAELYDWLTGLGMEFLQGEVRATNGTSRPREHFIAPSSGIDFFEQQALERGAEIHLETKCVSIIQDPITKRVLGIQATGPEGETLYYKAKRGLVMSSGGYAMNVDMMNEYVMGKGAENLLHSGHVGDDGTGMLACMELGVATRHISYIGLLCTSHPEGFGVHGCAMYHMGAILVNQEGERFVDESRGYTNIWPDVLQQTDQVCYCIYDQAIADENSNNNSSYYDHQKNVDSGLLIEAQTIEELAEKIGCDAATLQATLDQYNGDVEATGVDSVFGRDHRITESGDLITIAQAPFYAWKTAISVACTQGGLKKDLTCQALDVKGNVVPGLFLAGNISHYSEQGITAGTRQSHDASGTGFGGALAFGRYVSQQIAQLMEPWDEA